MIRNAFLTDVPAIEALGLRLKIKTPYATWSYDRERALKQIRYCIGSNMGCAFVDESDGKLTGIILGSAQEMWFSTQRVASDLIFYAERPGCGYFLLRRFMSWAWSIKSVHQILLGQSSGIDIDTTERLYRRMKFRKIGGMYELGRFD
jgi:hypothetical protein